MNGNGTELAKRESRLTPRGLPIDSMEDLWRLATAAVKGNIAPKDVRSVEDAFARMAMGMELGIPPMTALRGIANINGRPSVWGSVATGLVAASGELEYVKEWYEGDRQTRTAICEVKRVNRPNNRTARFGYGDAERAGLLQKDTYRHYLDDMLMARARSRAYNGEFPDVLQGMTFIEIARDIEPDQPADDRPRSVSVAEKIRQSPLLADETSQPPTGEERDNPAADDTSQGATAGPDSDSNGPATGGAASVEAEYIVINGRSWALRLPASARAQRAYVDDFLLMTKPQGTPAGTWRREFNKKMGVASWEKLPPAEQDALWSDLLDEARQRFEAVTA